ncbi:MAG: hypothetical protein M3Y49_20375 [Actinomycetota bacterium]|nr:hypothetical protein [Actinomycetota bacterium]
MFTQFKRASFVAVCTLAIMIGAATSADAMLLPEPGGSGSAQGGTGGHVVDPVVVTKVPWHLVMPISLVASMLLAVAFAATFIAISARRAAHPHHA